MLRAVHAEWIKFVSVRAPKLLLLLTVVGCAGISALIGLAARHLDDGEGAARLALAPLVGYAGMPGAVVLVSGVIGVLAVSTEVRYNTLRTTFLAVPNRWLALAAKTLVTAGVCAVTALLAVVLGLGAYSVVGGRGAVFGEPLLFAELMLVAALMAAVGVSVGTVVRNAAGGIALLLGYLLVVENVVWSVHRIAGAGPWLPLSNIQQLLGVGMQPMPWGAFGSLIYLVVLIGLIRLAATAVLLRRDV
jgi:ABC-2 type transport system permease protein